MGHYIIGFDDDRNLILPDDSVTDKTQRWSYIVENSSKIVTLLDLCGDDKYFKATAFGVSSSQPDYCMILIDSTKGMTQMAKDHIALSISLKIPFFIVVNKIDDPSVDFKEVMNKIRNTLKGIDINRKPFVVKNEM
mmetsp:Transcript_24740/g.21922  ORF Transcript_24740/g.21922 Transcript_24740/m.21922 type:complete len:136 (+) Transcript_24740:392-799(+)